MSILRGFSPTLSRKNKGHQQLSSADADEKDLILAGVDFNVKYVGCTEVVGKRGTGNETTEPAVQRAYDEFKRKGGDLRNLKKRVMVVSSENVVISEPCGDSVASFPIAKITFCNVNAKFERTFVFVAKNEPQDPFKAFVFQCESQEKTKELFKAFSNAFTVHFEHYQATKIRNPWSTQHEKQNLQEQKKQTKKSENESNFPPERKQENMNGSTEKFVEKKLLLETSNPPVTKESPLLPMDMNSNRVPVSEITYVTQPLKHPALLRVAEDFSTRQRSKTDPSNYQEAEQIVNNPLQSNGKTCSTPTLLPNTLDEFEAEFTKLAETRSSRSSSAIFGASLGHDWTEWTGAN